MENSPPLFDATGGRELSKVQSVGAMAAVGVAFTVAVLVMLGHTTRPESGQAEVVESAPDNPFADAAGPGENEALDEETCRVMSETIMDINARMSEGVTEAQGRYFRSRRNKLYLLMRERCGV